MATHDERLRILKMIEEGQITASEGATLLRALDTPQTDTPPLKGAPSNARWFRVRVTNTITGQHKINVNIPINLVNVGLRMGARFVPNLQESQYEELLLAIRHGRQGKIFEATDNDENEHIEVFVE